MDRADVYRMLASESPIWCIDAARLEGLVASLTAGIKAAGPSRQTAHPTEQSIAVVPIIGPLARRGNWLTEFFGASSYDSIRRGLIEAVWSRHVSAIVLYIDSPGGAALGVEELASDIRAAGKTKPVIAFVDVLCASAAYWIASAASRIYSTPSGEIGSVGAVMLHIDISRALDSAGVSPTFLTSRVSPFKSEGNEAEPLGAPARAHFQGQLDELAGRFIDDLAYGRNTTPSDIKTNYGKGRTLFAPDALKARMIDRILTFDDLLAGSMRPASGRGAAAPVGLASRPPATMAEALASADRAARHRRLEELRRG
jgi:capsid assembly protease